MAKDAKPLKDLNPFGDLSAEAKQAVEQTKEQALGAADTHFDFLKRQFRPPLQAVQSSVKS